MNLVNLPRALSRLRDGATDVASEAGPWLAPLPTAYLTARGTIQHLAWWPVIGIVSGAIVECLGLAAVSTALGLREYNMGRRTGEPAAPEGAAWGLVVVYVLAVVGLTVGLDTAPALSRYAPLAFPFLSLSGMACIALRQGQRRRLNKVAYRRAKDDKAAEKLRVAQEAAQQVAPAVEALPQPARRRNTRAAVLAIYRNEPTASVEDVAQQLDISHQAVSGQLRRMERDGAIVRNDGHVEVRA